jgi:hypothetical protein
MRRSIRTVLEVVTGILIAFGLDTWWDGQRDRSRQLELLTAVAAELRVNRQMLEESVEANQSAQNASQMLLARSRSAGPIPVDSTTGILDSVISLSWVVPTRSALDELTNSGGLSAIRNDSLRLALARWQSELVTARRTEDLATDVWNYELLPILVEKGDLSYLAGEHIAIPQNRFPVDLNSLMADRRFVNAIAMRVYARGWAIQTQQSLRMTAGEILSRIEESR